MLKDKSKVPSWQNSSNLLEQLELFLHTTFYTYAEAANALGVSKVTLWRWIKQGKIKTIRVGREVLVEKSLIEPRSKKVR